MRAVHGHSLVCRYHAQQSRVLRAEVGRAVLLQHDCALAPQSRPAISTTYSLANRACVGIFEVVELSADTFRLFVDSVQDYAIYLLAPDGTIQSWNAGAHRLKGYTAVEIIGQNFARFFSAEDREAGKPQSLLQRARDRGRAEDVGWRFRKDGSQFWASACSLRFTTRAASTSDSPRSRAT